MYGIVVMAALAASGEAPDFGKHKSCSGCYGCNGYGCYSASCHGYLTLEPDTIVEYLISEFYAPHAASGVRWDDAIFDIDWPAEPVVMNERDRTWPDFKPAQLKVLS